LLSLLKTLPRVSLFTAPKTTTQPPPPTTVASETGTVRTATSSSLFPGQHSSGNRRISPESVEKPRFFDRTLHLSFSLSIFPPIWTIKVLRPRIRSRRDPLRVKQRGTTSSSD
ncbi:unnamed protein product, partial [Prunus brigantina]